MSRAARCAEILNGPWKFLEAQQFNGLRRGRFMVFPLIGHAIWHAFRDLVREPLHHQHAAALCLELGEAGKFAGRQNLAPPLSDAGSACSHAHDPGPIPGDQLDPKPALCKHATTALASLRKRSSRVSGTAGASPRRYHPVARSLPNEFTPHHAAASAHNLTCLRRNALAITLTEEKAMAAAAMIGDNRMPRKG